MSNKKCLSKTKQNEAKCLSKMKQNEDISDK